MVLDRHVADARDSLELADRWLSCEAQLDLVVSQIAERVDAIHLDQPALADDRHAIATSLDLAEDVAG